MEPLEKKKRGRPTLSGARREPLCLTLEDTVIDKMRELAWEQRIPLSRLANKIFCEYIDTKEKR